MDDAVDTVVAVLCGSLCGAILMAVGLWIWVVRNFRPWV